MKREYIKPETEIHELLSKYICTGGTVATSHPDTNGTPGNGSGGLDGGEDTGELQD